MKNTVDMIVQNVADNGKADISFTVPRSEFEQTYEVTRKAVEEMGGKGVSFEKEGIQGFVVGLGMAKQSGVANRMFRSLSNSAINMQMITTSEIKISALVDREQALSAIRTVHQEFGLEKIDQAFGSSEEAQLPSRVQSQISVVDVVARLQMSEWKR